jgi:hemolysin activation/secretion protein
LYSNKTSKLNISVDADMKSFTNLATTGVVEGRTSDYRLNVYAITLSGEYADSVLAGAQNSASINLGRGNVNLNGSHNQADDLAAAHTDGSFARLRWNLSRNQFFTDTISVSLSGSGQFANGNLDSSEKFYLGGVSGVRAYPSSEGSGSEGYLVVAELRKYLPHNLTVSTFVDYGHVTQYVNNQDSLGKVLLTLNDYDLKGYGVAMGWQGPYNTNVKATFAHRIGSNPNPTANGNDQDGSKRYNVIWLNGGVSF